MSLIQCFPRWSNHQIIKSNLLCTFCLIQYIFHFYLPGDVFKKDMQISYTSADYSLSRTWRLKVECIWGLLRLGWDWVWESSLLSECSKQCAILHEKLGKGFSLKLTYFRLVCEEHGPAVFCGLWKCLLDWAFGVIQTSRLRVSQSNLSSDMI